jgi:hypothetical protein
VWTTLGFSAKFETNFNATDFYELQVEVHAGGLLKCFVDGVLVIEYTDPSPLTGTRVGLRTQNSEVEYQNAGVVTNGTGNQPVPTTYTNNHGWLKEVASGYQTVTSDTIAVFNTNTVSSSYTYTMHEELNRGDNGVIFALSSNTVTWEDASYYFFFITSSNHAYLAKINSGWSALQVLPITNLVDVNTVQILKTGGNIVVSINSVEVINYTDATVLTGTYCGIRAQNRKVTFTNVLIA